MRQDRRKVLVTGGTGFIGTRLCLQQKEQGHDVRAFGQVNTDPEAENRDLLEQQDVEVVLGSITDSNAVEAAVTGRDLVFHLAAAQHEMNVPDRHFHEVNVGGTRNVLDAAARADVERVVHGSTIGVYGDPDGVLNEASPPGPTNVYGRTKLEGEEIARSYSDRLSVIVIRIPEVYGPGDRRLLKLYRAVQKGRFFLIGRGDNLHHPMYVGDLTDAMAAAARASVDAGEVFLLAGREAVTTRQMVEAVATALDRAAPRLRCPMAPFLVAAVLMEGTLRPLGIQPPLHRRRLDFFRKSFELSADKARRVLGVVPRTSFLEGARATAHWYRERGFL